MHTKSNDGVAKKYEKVVVETKVHKKIKDGARRTEISKMVKKRKMHSSIKDCDIKKKEKED